MRGWLPHRRFSARYTLAFSAGRGVDAILVPWGGGGLTCGIATAAHGVRPSVRVYACEVEGAAPLTAALAAGKPLTIENRRTFVDGIGGQAAGGKAADIAVAMRVLQRRAVSMLSPKVPGTEGYQKRLAEYEARCGNAAPASVSSTRRWVR